ncbi:MAG: histidine ammonia-lyase [Planctomycetota bacterium]|nr:histidine ammonia-lyase [Planctomycetota bacterium]
MKPLVLTSGSLAMADALDVIRNHRPVTLGPDALNAMTRAQASVEDLTNQTEPTYGVNTGFGSLSRHRIDKEDLQQLQTNLIRSHAAGVGEPLPNPVVRGMMLLLAASLARGHSGIRPVVVTTLLEMLNHNVQPVIPSRGSVGASGDLAPLAHLALVLIGEGEVDDQGNMCTGKDALKRIGLAPLTLATKEGLALINGTHLMAAHGIILIEEAHTMLVNATDIAALSIDACLGTNAYLNAELNDIRNHPGPVRVATRMRQHLEGSEILASHLNDDPRVQDPYSLRAAPMVLGSCLDQLESIENVFARELGAVTDNPIVLRDGRAISGANFHGMPLALALDHLKLCVAAVAGISERRTYWLLSGRDDQSGIPAYLAREAGLESGLMIAQYTAAALVNEIRVACAPASCHNISTSAGIEDFNSFGPTAAFGAQHALDLAARVLAVELLCSAEAIELRRPLCSGKGNENLLGWVRQLISSRHTDRPVGPDIEALASALRTRNPTRIEP